jgi:hypothetical protein
VAGFAFDIAIKSEAALNSKSKKSKTERRGGARTGAGRKKGQASAQTKRRKAVAAQALAAGLSPLDYMLSIMRDEGMPIKLRYLAAVDAAPYVHPKLTAVAHSAGDQPVKVEHVVRWAA